MDEKIFDEGDGVFRVKPVVEQPPTEIPEAVKQAVRERWADQAEDILGRLKWDLFGSKYYFWSGKTYIGIEPDGYVHPRRR